MEKPEYRILGFLEKKANWRLTKEKGNSLYEGKAKISKIAWEGLKVDKWAT